MMRAIPVVMTVFLATTGLSVQPITMHSSSTENMDTNSWTVSYRLIPVADQLKYDNMTDEKIAYAQQVQSELFKALEANNLIVPGKSEEQLAREVTQMARERFGVENHWHKKIVRAGVNTLVQYSENPPDRIIQKDDIVIIDFGIIVNGYEADYARTYVLGNDPRKIKLKNDVEKAWSETQAWIKKQTSLKASDLFAYTRTKAREYGYASAGEIAGHIVGKYPHEQPADPKSWELDVHPDNHNDIFLKDANGNKRYWILEMHFVDQENKMGGYIEQLIW